MNKTMNQLLAEREKKSKERFNKGAHGSGGKKFEFLSLWELMKEELEIPFLIAANTSVGSTRGYYPYCVHYVPMKNREDLDTMSIEEGITFEEAEKRSKIPVLCQRGPLGKGTPCALCDAKVAAQEAGWFDPEYEPEPDEQEAIDALELLGTNVHGIAQLAIFAYASRAPKSGENEKPGLVAGEDLTYWQLGLRMWNNNYMNPDYRSREIIRTMIQLQKEDKTIFVPDSAEPENWKWVQLYSYPVKDGKEKIGLRVCKEQYDIPAEVFEACQKKFPAFHTWKTKDSDKGKFKTKSAVVAYDTQLKIIKRSFWGQILNLDITKGASTGCPLEPYLEA